MPKIYEVELNTEVKTSASVSGLAVKAGLSKAKGWFHNFFTGLSKTTVKRHAGSDYVTASSSGLFPAQLYLSDASSYLSAAKLLDEHQGLFSPKYFLLCHAIELALKAQILSTGGREREIRAIRHDLQAAWAKAIKNGLQNGSSLCGLKATKPLFLLLEQRISIYV
jgi:hypothetical protein